MKRTHEAQAGVMAPKSGSFDVKTAKAGLEEARAALAGHETPLSPEERRGARGWRDGFEVVVNSVAQLAPRYGVALVDAPIAEMEANLDEARQIEALLDVGREVVRGLEDRLRSRRASGVAAATTYYMALRQVARHNPKLRDLLVPAHEFFKPRKRSPKADKPAPASKATATAPADAPTDSASPRIANPAAPAPTTPTHGVAN